MICTAHRQTVRPLLSRIAVARGLHHGVIDQKQAKDLRRMIRSDEPLSGFDATAADACCTFAASQLYGDRKVGIDWAAVWQWIRDHWADILRFLLSLLPIFLMVI